MKQMQSMLIGLLLGLFLIPPQPVYGQFGGIVHDPKAYILQVEKRIEEAKRWVDTIKFYTDMGLKVAKAVSSLDGLLSITEETLARDDSTRATISELGKAVRGVFQLKRQLESLVKSRIQGLKNIQERFQQGILNPEADARDLELYLTTKMGRICDKRQADYERLAQMDVQLQRWIEELQTIERKLPGFYKQMYAADRALQGELAKPERLQSKEAIAQYQETVNHCEAQINELEKRHNDLLGLAEERCEKYHVILNYRAGVPSDLIRMDRAFGTFFQVKQQFIKSKLNNG